MSHTRVDYRQYIKKQLLQLGAIEQSIEEGPLDLRLVELMKLRISQINGCAFCVRLHTQLLRIMGESTERIDMISVWLEADCYSAQEKAAFRWGEALTKLSEARQVSVDLYQDTLKVFGEEGISLLTLAVNLINTWNRFGVSFQTDPQWIEMLIAEKRRAFDKKGA